MGSVYSNAVSNAPCNPGRPAGTGGRATGTINGCWGEQPGPQVRNLLNLGPEADYLGLRLDAVADSESGYSGITQGSRHSSPR